MKCLMSLLSWPAIKAHGSQFVILTGLMKMHRYSVKLPIILHKVYDITQSKLIINYIFNCSGALPIQLTSSDTRYYKLATNDERLNMSFECKGKETNLSNCQSTFSGGSSRCPAGGISSALCSGMSLQL